jgi:hypothetical protein
MEVNKYNSFQFNSLYLSATRWPVTGTAKIQNTKTSNSNKSYIKIIKKYYNKLLFIAY